jgi:CRISPR-associated protein Cmr3
MRIFIEPQETLLFRNSRPFDAGEVGYAETVFPPTPETLQGVVRSMIATQLAMGSKMSIAQVFNDADFVSLIGNRNSYGRFRISNIALARRNGNEIEPLYPVPAHIVKDENGTFRLKPEPKDNILSNMPNSMHYLVPDRPTKGKIESAEGWLSLTDLQTVLQPGADISKLKVIKSSEIYEREPRVGIGMDSKRKVTEEGLLYSTQMLRMKEKYGFLITIYIAKAQNSYERDEQVTQILNGLKKSGWVTIGGEQRAARFEILPDSLSTHTASGTLLYLATPAIFTHGWQPAQWTTNAPIASAISRYQLIGGWSLDTTNSGGGDAKSLRRCVPAGSVYFFDQSVPLPSPIGDQPAGNNNPTFVGHEEAEEVIRQFKDQPAGNNNPTFVGYGITMTGDWKQ